MGVNVLTFNVPETFETTECCMCGVNFAMTSTLMKQRRYDAKEFYCPNGHSMVFKDGERARLIRERQEAEARANLEASRANTARQELAKAEKKMVRLKRRVAAGVCVECKRSFPNVARHMKSKHPDLVSKA
jgi:hypothetical protein